MATKKKAAVKKNVLAKKKVPAKKKPSHASAGGNGDANGAAGVGKIHVRMYNVGFGDCFLVRMPGQGRDLRILVDCGSVSAGSRSMADVVKQVVQDVTDSDGTPRIDVVIATHRHKDHVSGFANAAWHNVEVSEVWMPWTEDPADPKAKEIRDTQSNLALALNARLEQFQKNPALTPMGADRVAKLNGLMLNALSNEAAMDTLHQGFKGVQKRRFLPKTGDPLSFTSPALPSVTISVLGPSHDPEVIRDMDPPSGKSYLQMSDGLLGGGMPEPFHGRWVVSEKAYLHKYKPSISADDMTRLRALGSDMELTVATSLDKAVNGTSLMLVLRVGSTHMLFPGDAQWGTWQAALADEDKRALMKKASFYKIGHHGSHNATPKEYVTDVMGANMLAMVSTKSGTYNNVPRGPLLDAFEAHRTHMVRSDELNEAPAEFTVTGDFYADLEIAIM